jgi:hypothetical protein
MRPVQSHQICAERQQEITEELGIPIFVEKTMWYPKANTWCGFTHHSGKSQRFMEQIVTSHNYLGRLQHFVLHQN